MVDFSKAKDLYRLQKQAREIQRELKDTEIEAKSNDGWVSVVFNGEQHLTEVTLSEEALKPENKKELEKQIQNTVSQAISRSQALAAEKMKDVMGGMGLPGM
ncbi:nucleoid-associated protein, YbaB/EbfC family [Candidatus Berkelbacteria bacterium CG08_land_8_20_14_0_20_39_8]|uniref:Nucleoid-associated protein, YbaB/EbfC family n=1 Tax=Candidatus Berkelbacteria bacterium CG08_land_8_20_14_0_20_39_8 TaxID=1974511 RepID=A0A2M6YCF1_9BACT|nr:MAG: nucleoid-associated protein, YbaB/EbfC family [Candidatus Berkelbacteria bacterium CG08_land_8_20_14_0_20_39_8]